MSFLTTTRRLFAASVWGPNAISIGDTRVATVLRVTLPRFYFTMVVFGSFGIVGGTPSIRATFGDTYAHIWSLLLTVAALACLGSLAYPGKWWRIEIASAMFLNSLLFLYIGALIFTSITGHDLGKAGVAAALFAVTELPWWQIQDVFRERKRNGWK